MSDRLPRFDAFFNPTLQALRDLGGSATNDEILERVVELLKLPSSATEVLHSGSSQTELSNRLGWARTYLKKVGLIESSGRGVWSLTKDGRETEQVDRADVKRTVRAMRAEDANEPEDDERGESALQSSSDLTSEQSWIDKVLKLLLEMEPSAFERLCQRLLRESGFIEVEVSGRSGDGGIDGRGVLRLGGLISFTVMFQSKRYRDAVGASVVRDFRGALVGRADKGLLITTGRFTLDAKREATRDGATPIDLIDGVALVEKLKALGLGIRTRQVEHIDIDDAWFAGV